MALSILHELRSILFSHSYTHTQFDKTEKEKDMPRSRGDVNFRSLFQDFNASKFVVFTSLLIFSLLYALKLDGVLNWSWWSVFIPIWIWKGIVGKFLTNLVVIMPQKPKLYYLFFQTILIHM